MALTTRRVRDPFFFDLAAMEQAVTEQRFDELFGRMLATTGRLRGRTSSGPTCSRRAISTWCSSISLESTRR